MKITKEASTFYYTVAMLKTCKRNLQYLVDSRAVGQYVKHDFKTIINNIRHLERECVNVLDADAAKRWEREWTEKDYEVFANVFGMMNDMDEQQRATLEEFTEHLVAGNIKAELSAV